MALVLVVDDDPHIRDVVVFALEQAHHQVLVAANGLEALAVYESKTPDVIILDVMMPEMDGTEVCRRIRASSSVPILMLSSRDDEFDKVLGLELGADDYVTKPFSPRELLARVKALLRRVETPVEQDDSTILKHGRVVMDLEAFEVKVGEVVIELTSTEFSVLLCLLKRPRKVFSRADLMQQAYSVQTIVSDRTIDSHVRHIREKFAALEMVPIDTVHGVGYRAGACE